MLLLLDVAEHKFLRGSCFPEKPVHSILYRARANEIVGFEGSAQWLTHGSNRADREGAMCAMQDSNIFCGKRTVCPHSRERPRTVDHLATQCEKLLYLDYTRRHNEVVRVLHRFMCTKYGMRRGRRMKGHVFEPLVANEHVEIRFDMRVRTDTKIAANRPDLQVWDKKDGRYSLLKWA